MKLALSLVSYAATAARAAICARSLDSLARTDLSGVEHPYLHISYRRGDKNWMDYEPKFEPLLCAGFELSSVEEAPHLSGNVNVFASVSADTVLQEHPDATHIYLMWDDFVYNPQWFKQLLGVIERHPGAVAWSVYKQAYQRHHKVLETDGTDVVVTSIDGLGCVTREEWDEYGASKRGDFTCPAEVGGGCTLDLYHSVARKGQRWATKRDWIDNIGIHPGIEQFDHAIDFVGE